jgi:LPXTG-site transpeptidase (sortase) family protein
MSGTIRKIKNKPTAKKRIKILKTEENKVRFFLLMSGLVLIVLGIIISRIPKNFKTQIEATPQGDIVISFSQEPVKIDNLLLNNSREVSNIRGKKEEVKAPPFKVIVPSLGIDINVKEANVVKGFWEVFPEDAGWGKGSAYPEDKGNTVIFAHAREGMFLPLKKAKIGLSVYVITKDKWYQYVINEIREVQPSQTEVIAATDSSVLTLYTCSGFSDSKRLIVIANRII